MRAPASGSRLGLVALATLCLPAALAHDDAYERERAESRLLRRGEEALPELARALEADGPALDRFRADRIFHELLAGFLAEFEGEVGALTAARAEAAVLRARRDAPAGASVPGGPLSDLEVLRLEELEERIREREPRVGSLVGKLESFGLPALNGALGRRAAGRDRLRSKYDETIQRVLAAGGTEIFPSEGRMETLRYSRSLLWAWIVERGSPGAAEAEELLREHIERTLRDLDSQEDVVRRRAAVELYMLGERGRKALEPLASRPGIPFLLNLLRYRIHPSTYARTGIDLADYAGLNYRERRQKVFDYTRVAGEDAIPTLRAIVRDESLEPSLFVRIGAAKALAGLRDLSGFELLIQKHPDLTLTRPEVSRDLALVQGANFIRDEQYGEAVEVLKKVLEEFPFDFRANYHVAFAYLLLKDFARAIHHFEIAKRIHPDDQLTLYNLACAYALSGKKEEALRELEAAVSAGFDDAEHIENDPDLESLREEPRYRKILEDLRGSSPQG